MPKINVRLKGHSYPIIIGTNLDRKTVRQIKSSVKGNRLFVFFDANVYSLYGKTIEKQFTIAKLNFESFTIPSGEKYKSEETLKKLYDYLLHKKISRSDFILAVGGGVTTDIVGYTAATILRGVKWGAVSTTLLGMVDAAIGGKTGINHTRGKNLIGAFWQPSFVICDLNYLQTLPRRELIAGMGEILKYTGLIGGKSISLLQSYIHTGKIPELKKLRQFVSLGAAYKSIVVIADERESGRRMFLNLGHTFAHAIEKTLGYGKLLHGEAVIIGLLAAVKLSKLENPNASKELSVYEDLVKDFIQFVRYYPIKPETVLELMQIDKKRSGNMQKFVLLKRPGKPFIATGLNEKQIKESLKETLIDYRETHH